MYALEEPCGASECEHHLPLAELQDSCPAVRVGLREPSSTTSYASKHDQGEVESVVYNRAILLFTSDSEAVRRIHQVCCRLDDLAAIK